VKNAEIKKNVHLASQDNGNLRRRNSRKTVVELYYANFISFVILEPIRLFHGTLHFSAKILRRPKCTSAHF